MSLLTKSVATLGLLAGVVFGLSSPVAAEKARRSAPAVHALQAFASFGSVTTGYWEVESDGFVFPMGDAAGFGPGEPARLAAPVTGAARTPFGEGYWEVATDGGIFSFGDAAFYGSTGAMRLNKPVVGMAATPTGHGYWLVASDGGIFTFGDAAFYGSTGATRLNQPVVGMAATPTGHGYWLVASDGGIFTFGDAEFDGSVSGSASIYTYPARTVALMPQSPPIGSIAQGSAVAGVWLAHGAVLVVGTDGRFAVSYRTYNFCGSAPGPCDYIPPGTSLIINGGSASGVITALAGNHATVSILSDIGGSFNGTTSMSYDPVNDAINLGTFHFCGPNAPVSYCGA